MVPFFHKVSELSSPEIAQTVFPMFPYVSLFLMLSNSFSLHHVDRRRWITSANPCPILCRESRRAVSALTVSPRDSS